ncbi:Smr/MutS family protein [Thiomicrorhabdus sp. Kp2]|uniref:Smr/MutS family protein n=1 Tax=Thiomicrorhabdus sp. Kp2 TaxID=1123518 RepID=UPI0003F508D1|nr:Smr/MutS family protein [Thiomicrorhabdus sp. Kp2]
MQEEDKSIFLQAMQDVTPLNSSNKPPVHNTVKQKQSQTELLRQLKKRNSTQHKTNASYKELQLDMGKPIAKVTAFQALLYYKKGMRLQEVTKLKKGDFHIQHSLDLHGLTVEQAEKKMIDFLSHAYYEKLRYIRIIHGKGYNSKEEYPALKNLVNLILRQTKSVIGFASTPEKDGGTGAVNVFLKAQ